MTHETVHLVPHTHWDREWYEPFQRFRLRLVDLLDEVTARAEADPDFHFTLDGQLAAVDDYLEVRPEATGRIAALVQRGQFAIGPWAILLDEFLCSGENIVRNLELGLHRAEQLGGAMEVGYLPDMFGHTAQMPQILAGAGLRQACVFRGVPAAITFHAFRWEAPDGTAVRTEYLPGGYGNAAELFEDPDNLVAGAAGHVHRLRPWYGDDPVLGMYGTDHSAPLPTLSASVAALNAAAGDGRATVALRMCTLAGYLSRFDPDDVARLPAWRGELRSHARANILPGVLSNRPHLKQTLSRAERVVERYAEPFAALWTPAGRWPGRLLEMAWRRLIESSCHDSVTGCGVDETAVQVAARIAEAEQIGTGVGDRTLDALAARVPAGSVLVANPSPHPRTAVVRLRVPAVADPVGLRLPDGTALPVQVASAVDDAPLYLTRRPADVLAAGLRKGALGLEFLALPIRDVVLGGDRELVVTVALGGTGLDTAHRSLAGTVADTGGEWTLRVVGVPTVAVFTAVPVPPLGWTTVTPGAGGPAGAPAAPPPGMVTVTGSGPGSTLDNGRLRVAVEPDGTLTLSGPDLPTVCGVGRIVEGGDAGDLYNYGPPDGDHLVAEPASVHVAVRQTGPLVGAVEVRRRYHWRAGAPPSGGTSAAPVPTEVLTEVEVRAGEPFCRLTVSFENRHADHRVRLHVPVPEPADHSHAEGQFAVVRRGLTAEGGHGEVPLPTFPAYSFVDAGGMAILLDQVSEYELLPAPADLAAGPGPSGAPAAAGGELAAADGDRAGAGGAPAAGAGDPAGAGGELAVTLLRATGVISRPDHPLRAEPAGPVIATPQAQCTGQVVTTRLAVMPHRHGWEAAGVVAAAEAFRLPLVAVPGTRPPGGGAGSPAAGGVGVDSAGTGGAAGSTPAAGGAGAHSTVAGGAPDDRAGEGLEIRGDGVVLTSLRRRDERWLEARVVAMTDSPTGAVLGPVRAARRADLRGRPGAEVPVVDGAARVDLRPWEIATVQFTR